MSSIVGIGVDLARIDRFYRLLDLGKDRVIDRIFTEAERDYCLCRRDPSSHLAVRFAAKEAFLKALGLGLRRGITWHDIEVVRDDLGAPSLKLSGQAARMCENRHLCATHLSYSHDGQYGVATVVLEK
ncbi:MAG TPA: holo-ACP synthase [Desulfuromonadales bacterium]|nr:holo-ACP synthase [Desulfuromonadales bacterium]